MSKAAGGKPRSRNGEGRPKAIVASMFISLAAPLLRKGPRC